MIIGGFLLAGLGVGLALDNPGSGVLIGLGVGLVLHYLFEKGWISRSRNNGSSD